jgi:hypothetical protein
LRASLSLFIELEGCHHRKQKWRRREPRSPILQILKDPANPRPILRAKDVTPGTNVPGSGVCTCVANRASLLPQFFGYLSEIDFRQ